MSTHAAAHGTDCDVTVIGAGIVGLATAHAIARRAPALDILVVDKEPSPARHQTGRNSGVVHSGLYYAPGSAKARLVARGRELLAQNCAEWGVPIDWCGKVVVATQAQALEPLGALADRGRANGVELRRIGPRELHELEPHAAGLAALHVPGAGIVDYGRVAEATAAHLTGRGVQLALDSRLVAVEPARSGSLRLAFDTGSSADGPHRASGTRSVTTRWLVNCAGLHSDRIARLAGCDTDVTIVPFRGEYHQLAPSARHLVRNLIYPVPDPRWPFLGVHMTRMTDGSVHVGPNAVLAFGREAYEGGINVADTRELAMDPGLRRLAGRYWRTGATEMVRSRSLRLLLRDVRRLLPDVERADLQHASSGIRAQALAPDGTLLDDFAFATSPHAVHVLNAPSPAATASFAIGEVVADRLDEVMSTT